MAFFHTPLVFGAPAPYLHALEFQGAVRRQETRVMVKVHYSVVKVA